MTPVGRDARFSQCIKLEFDFFTLIFDPFQECLLARSQSRNGMGQGYLSIYNKDRQR